MATSSTAFKSMFLGFFFPLTAFSLAWIYISFNPAPDSCIWLYVVR